MPHSPTTRRPLVALALALVLALTLGACSDDDSSSDDAGTDTTAAADATTTTAAPADPATSVAPPTVPDEVTVGLGTTEYGDVLTAPDGRTLYVFDEDEGGESSCVDAECVEKWPPLLAGAATLADGGDASVELGTVDRPDGTTQVTVNGRPVYVMGVDRPGEALCQGGDGVWWIVGTDGEAIRDAA